MPKLFNYHSRPYFGLNKLNEGKSAATDGFDFIANTASVDETADADYLLQESLAKSVNSEPAGGEEIISTSGDLYITETGADGFDWL